MTLVSSNDKVKGQRTKVGGFGGFEGFEGFERFEGQRSKDEGRRAEVIIAL